MTHIPVLLQETLQMMALGPHERVLDCTFGGGGHTSEILKQTDCYLLGIDCDPSAIARAEAMKKQYGSRFDFEHMKFSGIGQLAAKYGKFDAVLFDLGISSLQLDDAERGFSFMQDGKLDMRMSMEGPSAYEIVNEMPRRELSLFIDYYGEEPRYIRIARMIDEARKIKPIETTTELADIVRKAYGLPPGVRKRSKTDVATKTFQAIRILVNYEMRELLEALAGVLHVVNDQARIVTISFQGREGKEIKDWAKSRKDRITPINRRAIKPTREETSKNPRARSAILRGFVYNDEVEAGPVGEGKES
jgi:16S rRNA (cytosine1402-N4)-methyltransferase